MQVRHMVSNSDGNDDREHGNLTSMTFDVDAPSMIPELHTRFLVNCIGLTTRFFFSKQQYLPALPAFVSGLSPCIFD